MIISEKVWLNYITGLRKVNEEAAKIISDFVERFGLESATVRDNLIELSYQVAQKYGEAAATLACEMYDATAALSGLTLPPAEPAAMPTYGEVAKTVNGILKQSQNAEMLSSGVGRLVKRTGVDTTIKNGMRDGAQFAWVPSGDTCAFCITLASRDWQYISKRALKNGHAEHIHSNCDCTYAVRFDESSTVAGYDPKYYKELYDKAPLDHWNTPDGKPPKGNTTEDEPLYQQQINAMRRNAYGKNKEAINDQKRSAYEKRKELNSSAAEEIRVD